MYYFKFGLGCWIFGVITFLVVLLVSVNLWFIGLAIAFVCLIAGCIMTQNMIIVNPGTALVLHSFG